MKKRIILVFLCVAIAAACFTSCQAQTPYIGENGNWWVGDEDTGVCAQGPQGEKGDTGEQGEPGNNGQAGQNGLKGEDGKSAYEIYCEQFGYTKSESEWLIEINNALSKIDSEDIYEVASKATVVLECYNKQGEKFSTGSGFIISEDGIVATAHHVIEKAYTIKATMPSGNVIDVSGVVGFDADRDIALLRIESEEEFSHLDIEENGIIPGEAAYSFGIPLGFLDGSFSSGVVASSLREEPISEDSEESYKVVQFTAPISSGNSGGPLLNNRGKVIGIVTSTYVYGEDLNLATFIEELQHIDLSYERSVQDFFRDTVYYQTKFLESEHDETESNGTKDTADIIENGYTVCGYCSYSDKDFFKFTVNGDESIRITLACIVSSNMSIGLEGSAGSISLEWYSYEYQNTTVNYTSLTLAPGTYYIQTYGTSFYQASSYGLYAYWKTEAEHNAFAYGIYETDFLP